MHYARRLFLRLAAGASAAAFSVAAWSAEEYPSRPIRLVVPFPAGGTTDVVARIIVRRLETELGKPIIIENKPGAGGNIGAEAVAKSAADGYTLLYGTVSNYALNVALYPKLVFNPATDLVPAGMTALVPILIVVAPDLGVKDMDGLIKLLKANPGKFAYASAGVGTSAHIACHLFLQLTGTQADHIPYKGTAPALMDISAGRVAFGVASPAVAASLVKAGRLIPIAAVSPNRLPTFPNLPTTTEAGLKGYDAYSWNAITAPAGTPAPILDRLNAAIEKTVADPAVVKQMLAADVVPMPGYSRARTASFMKAELDKWVPIIKNSGMKAD